MCVGVFYGSELICLSEVGLFSYDVDVVCEQFSQCFGLQLISLLLLQFVLVGDDEGLLIIVVVDCCWFFEQKDLFNVQGVQLQVGDVSGSGELCDVVLGWWVWVV